MARNSEKAMTALARWRQLQLKLQGKLKDDRRPFSVAEEFNVRRAEHWRRDVIREIARKVTQIQNAGLGEFKIRDLNDEINKLLREKERWEIRIVELGGTDYKKIGPKMLDEEGKEVRGNRGYKYFGAAKDLPGVRELFEKEPARPPIRNRHDLMRLVDPEYFGYMDEDDEYLLEAERKCELESIAAKVKEYEARTSPSRDLDEIPEIADDSAAIDAPLADIAPPTIPSQDEIERILVMRKKQQLLEKYVSKELAEQEMEAKDLLGKHD